MQRWATIGGIVSLALFSTGAAPTNVTEAVPLQAIPALLDLFKTHQVVGLGEGPHGNVEGHVSPR
jgi:erythromycin esterase-like protein